MNKLSTRKWQKLQGANQASLQDIEPILNQAIHLQQQGQFAAAQKLYQQILTIDPDHAMAHHRLGLSWAQQGEFDDAYPYLAHAAKMEPHNSEYICSLGAVTMDLGEYHEAIEIFQEMLHVFPNSIDAYYNLSLAYHACGYFQEAIAAALRVLAIDKNHVNAHANLIQSLIFEYPTFTWDKILDELDFDFKVLQVNEKAINQAIAAWVRHDIDKTKEYLQYFQFQNEQVAGMYGGHFVKYVRAQNAFYEYLNYLLRTEHQPPAASHRLYMLGDSHSLSPANSIFEWHERPHHVQATLIKGMKAWHLANEQQNQYKVAFELRLAEIPDHSEVILTVGEIDCRLQEGIWPHAQRTNQAISAVIQAVTQGYIKTIDNLTKDRELTIYICGTPATNASLTGLNEDQKQQFSAMLKEFNASLQHHCLEHQLQFLDLYTLTHKNPELMLDGTHVQPKAWQVLLNNSE